jgi:hypothetical protein
MANRIHASGDFVHEEAPAGAAGIKPGMLIKLNSSGEAIVNPTSEGALGDELLVVTEDALQGGSVTGTYTSGDVLSYMIPSKGTKFRGLVLSGEDIAIGDRMANSATGGKFMESASPVIIPAIAMESSGGALGADTLLLMRAS